VSRIRLYDLTRVIDRSVTCAPGRTGTTQDLRPRAPIVGRDNKIQPPCVSGTSMLPAGLLGCDDDGLVWWLAEGRGAIRLDPDPARPAAASPSASRKSSLSRPRRCGGGGRSDCRMQRGGLSGCRGCDRRPRRAGSWDWPRCGHDAQHTFHGRTTPTRSSVKKLKVAWSFPTGDAPARGPVVLTAPS